jgi:hypothetical protein
MKSAMKNAPPDRADSAIVQADRAVLDRGQTIKNRKNVHHQDQVDLGIVQAEGLEQAVSGPVRAISPRMTKNPMIKSLKKNPRPVAELVRGSGVS